MKRKVPEKTRKGAIAWLFRGRIAEWAIILAGVPVQPFNMLGIAGASSMLDEVAPGAEKIKSYILIGWLLGTTLGGWWTCVWMCRKKTRPASIYWALGSLICAHGMILTAIGFLIWNRLHG